MHGISNKVQSINGVAQIPGDKSTSHRALILASQTIRQTKIFGLSKCKDVLHTQKALESMGINITYENDICIVNGLGVGGLIKPNTILNMGNSATTARLMLGLLSTHPFISFLSGDESLNKRPMDRVIEPLSLMGGNFITDNNKLPLAIIGFDETIPITYTMKVPSAQVKSAILLAALNTAGITTIIEPTITRNHTEIMLKYLGAKISITKTNKFKEYNDQTSYNISSTLSKTHSLSNKSHTTCNIITLQGQTELSAKDITIPADSSAAAFITAAALMLKNSEVLIPNMAINFTRMGFYQILISMGATIIFTNYRNVSGEEVADVLVKSSQLNSIEISETISTLMIDEYPIMAIICSAINGVTTMAGLSELRIKESDRLQTLFTELRKCGVKIELTKNDSLIIHGKNYIAGGCTINTNNDHRIAMAFLILGMISKHPIAVDNIQCIENSFPEFIELMNRLGAKITKN